MADLADYSNLDTARATSGNLSELWLSRYNYFSSGRDANLQGGHTQATGPLEWLEA